MVEGNPEYAPTSQEIKARAGQKEWTPNSYSNDPEYSDDDLGDAIDAFEAFENYDKQLVTDGGRDAEYDRDPRVVEAERYAGVTMDRPGNSVNPKFPAKTERPPHKEPHDEGPGYEDWVTAFEDEKVMSVVERFFGSEFEAIEEELEGDLDPRIQEALYSEFGIDPRDVQ